MNSYERQLALEKEAISLGVTRYMEQLQNGELTDVPAGLLLVRNALSPLSDAIEEWPKITRAVHHTKYMFDFFAKFKPSELAYFTLRRVVNALSTPQSIQSTCIDIVTDLIDHLEYSKYMKQAPAHHHVVTTNMSTVASPAHKKKVLMRAKRVVGIEDEYYNIKQRVQIGARLINLCIDSTGICQTGKSFMGDSSHKYLTVLEPTDKIAAWIDTKHGTHSLMNPVHMPMVHPPRDWTTPFDGGYLSNNVSMRMRLVRTKDRESLLELAEHDMPEVYKCVNNLQRIPWRINKYILDVAQELWRSGVAIGKDGKYLPKADPREVPTKPWANDEEYEWYEANEPEVIAKWKREAADTYEFNAKQRSKRVATAQKFWMAEKFRDEKEIFFCWTLDWRGRVYPHVTGISCQSDDLGASLIEFGNGHRLGRDGAYALACSVSEYYGNDKVSLDDRVQWTKDHTQQILDVANYPLDNLWWIDSDKPFHFLNACREWAGYIEQGEDYVTHFRCQRDGSNNGNQHFAAMRKCPSGSSVNLVPHIKPADVYREVADVMRPWVVADAIAGNEIAQWWQTRVDRGIAKRGTMTVSYGVTPRGVVDQIIAELKKMGVTFDDVTVSEDTKLDHYTAAKYLGDHMWNAINKVITSSRDTMDWMKESTKLIMKEKQPLRWHNKAGFLVIQKYKKAKTMTVNTYWGPVRLQLTVKTTPEGSQIDTRKMVASISPCYIHSQDAAHLMLTANAMHDQGVTDFSPIHDSFGVSPCFVPLLSATLREEFIKMYEDGQALEQFRKEILAGLPEAYHQKVAPSPSLGTLDLNGIRESLYFFA